MLQHSVEFAENLSSAYYRPEKKPKNKTPEPTTKSHKPQPINPTKLEPLCNKLPNARAYYCLQKFSCGKANISSEKEGVLLLSRFEVGIWIGASVKKQSTSTTAYCQLLSAYLLFRISP